MSFLASLDKKRYGGVIDFAAELGERFPDLFDSQIILACSEYYGTEIMFDSVLAHAVIEAYETGKTLDGKKVT